VATSSNPNADEFAQMIKWLKNSNAATNHPYGEIQGNDRLGDTYATMMHAIAAHLEAVNDHPDTSTCFIGGLLMQIGDDMPHDHPMAEALPVEDHQDERPVDVPSMGEVLPQEDQDAIVAAFMAALDSLPTHGQEGPQKPAKRFYPAEGTTKEGERVTCVVDRETGEAYPFGSPRNAMLALERLESGEMTINKFFGGPAEAFGITL